MRDEERGVRRREGVVKKEKYPTQRAQVAPPHNKRSLRTRRRQKMGGGRGRGNRGRGYMRREARWGRRWKRQEGGGYLQVV